MMHYKYTVPKLIILEINVCHALTAGSDYVVEGFTNNNDNAEIDGWI